LWIIWHFNTTFEKVRFLNKEEVTMSGFLVEENGISRKQG
jgi:hypothetical protein